MDIAFVIAAREDSNLLADIRVEAMSPSLEAVGRFDPMRARNRFLDQFDPCATYKIVRNDLVIGFFVLKDRKGCILLDHLYVVGAAQGQGIGRDVVAYAKSHSNEAALPLQLCALNGSKANDFYLENGFEVTRIDDLDTHYEYRPNR